MRINAMTSTVGFALLCTSTVAKAEWDEHWVTPLASWVVNVHAQSAGLPAQSCKQAQEEGLDTSSLRAFPSPAPNPLPYPSVPEDSMSGKLPKIYSAGKRIKPFQTLPHQLPLQPLEGAPSDLAALAAALRIAESGGRLRMTFFGASHTGGDYWTGHIRRILQARYGDIGHGFTMPVSLYRGARGADINLCSGEGWLRDYIGKQDGHGDGMLGLGMSVSSSDPDAFGWLETTHSNPLGRSVSTYEILALGQPDGGRINVQVDSNSPIIVPTHSDEHGLIHTRVEVPEGSHRLSLSPFGDGEIRLFGVSAERSGPGVLVDSIGIRGREARTWLRWNGQLLAQSLGVPRPDILVLAYGTNEANSIDYKMEHYRRDLRKVLTKARSILPAQPCILVGPSDRAVVKKKNRYLVWQRTAMVAQVQREIAPEFGCVFWDWQQATGGEGSMVAWW